MRTNSELRDRIRRLSPPSPIFKNCAFAFLFGGGICFFSELYREWLISMNMPAETAGLLVTVTLIFIAVALTVFGVFDSIARVAGAGTLVPVTGFANAVVSPAIDNKSEGTVTGVGSKIFTVAGPVILFAVLSGTVYGLIYYLITTLGQRT